MLDRTAHSLFHSYPPCGCSGRGTGVRRQESRRYEVPVACYMRRGTFLLLTAAFTSCLLSYTGTELVAAAGTLRTPSEHFLGAPSEGSNSGKQALVAAAPHMREGSEKSTAAPLGAQVVGHPESRETSKDSDAAASQRHMPESRVQPWRPGVRGALHPAGHPQQSAERIQNEGEKYVAETKGDAVGRSQNEGRQEGRHETADSFGPGSEAEKPLAKRPIHVFPAEGAHRAADEVRKEKDTGGDREATKQEGGTVVAGKPLVRKEAKEEVGGTEKEGVHEEHAKGTQSSASRKRSVVYEGKQEGHEDLEKGKRKEGESPEKKEEEDKRTDEKEKEKRQSSKTSDDNVVGRGVGRGSSNPVSEKEGRPEEKGVQPVIARPFVFEHPFCLFPNSRWCTPDLTAQGVKSAEGVPDIIRRANAFVSSMFPLPFFYIPLSIPRFWGGEEATSVESGGAGRCRFTFTIDPMGPSEEIRLYMMPSQRRIGLTAGRSLKHSERDKTYSGVYGTETRMHAVSSFAPECKVSTKLLKAGLIGWSYAGKTENGVKILVTFPSETHAKELVDRKELSEKAYKIFIDEQDLNLLTPSEKCLLSGRTPNECEQLKAEAGQKRETTITISTEGYAENEIPIPEFVYE